MAENDRPPTELELAAGAGWLALAADPGRPRCGWCPVDAGRWCVSAEHPRSCALARKDREALEADPRHDAHWLRSIAAKSVRGKGPATVAAEFRPWDYARREPAPPIAEAAVVDFEDAAEACPDRGEPRGDLAPCARHRRGVTLDDCRRCLITGNPGGPSDG